MFWHFVQSKDRGQVELNHPAQTTREIAIINIKEIARIKDKK